mgnify:CR=1 FL=1
MILASDTQRAEYAGDWHSSNCCADHIYASISESAKYMELSHWFANSEGDKSIAIAPVTV